MTDCPRGDVRDLLPDLLHGRLDARTRSEVERHVADCADCAAELRLLRAARGVLTRETTLDVDRVAEGVARALRAPAPRVGTARRTTWSGWRAAAAIAVILAGAAVLAARLRSVQRVTGGGAAPSVASAPPAAAAPAHVAPEPTPPAISATPVAPRVQVAEGPSTRGTKGAGRPRPVGLTMDGGVGDLSTADVEMLLKSLDSLSAVPDEEPSPVTYDIGPGVS